MEVGYKCDPESQYQEAGASLLPPGVGVGVENKGFLIGSVPKIVRNGQLVGNCHFNLIFLDQLCQDWEPICRFYP